MAFDASKTPPFNLDGTLENADWTKSSWDLPYHDVESLRAFLKSQGISVKSFKRTPVYRRNVETLEWLQDL